MVWGAVGRAIQSVADFLVDETCHACRRPVEATARLPRPDSGAAAALARPVRVGRGRVGIDTRPLCRACCHQLVAWTEPVTIATFEPARPLVVWPALETDDRLLSVIHALKFSRRERLSPWLARALSDGLPARALLGDPDAVLVPVPMDRASLRRRGFNQAERLASAFAAQVGRTVERDAIVKTRATAPQSLLGRSERIRNVAGVMRIETRAAIVGRRVILVDDLVTTGATAAACAAALWSAGAADVRVVCAGYRP